MLDSRSRAPHITVHALAAGGRYDNGVCSGDESGRTQIASSKLFSRPG